MFRRIFVLVTLAFFLPFAVKARYVIGAEMTYEHLNGNDFDFNIFRGCIGIQVASSSLIRNIQGNFKVYKSIPPMQEINSVCATTPSTCQGGSYPSLQIHVFEDTFIVPKQCSSWTFCWSKLNEYRNASITNSINPDSTSTYIEALLNNRVELNNNTLGFKNIPVSYLKNVIHLGPVEKDEDPVVFRTITSRNFKNADVVYKAPLSVSNPLISNPSFNISHSITHSNIKNSIIDIQGYRTDVLIGSIVQDSHNLDKNLFILKLTAYNNKKDRQKLENVVMRLSYRPINADLEFPREDSVVVDSILIDKDELEVMEILDPQLLRDIKRQEIISYIRSGYQPIPVEKNEIIGNGQVEELSETDNSFLIKNNQEYIAAAAFEEDTLYYIFKTSESKIADSFSEDTSYALGYSVPSKIFHIARIDFYFHSDSVAVKATLPEEPVVENEKSNTVTKVMKELEAENTWGVRTERTTKDLIIVLNYDFDDTQFIEKHSGSLDSLVTLLKKYPKLHIFIGAHTDSKGTDSYNIDLSKRRAKSIVDYLNTHGISKRKIKSKGFGESVPLVPNENPDGSDNPDNRWLNRRVDITILEH